MSTRSLICKEQSDGSYYGIYCHWDGYLTYNGAMLLDHYSDAEKLDKLLELGDISSLQEEVSPDPSLPHTFDGEKQDNVTLAYGRDRGETDIEARTITLEQAKESWCEYMYVFGKDGKWRYYDLCDDDNELRDVAADLAQEFKKLGIDRPPNDYGWPSDEEVARIKAEQAQMKKAEAVM